MKETKIFAHVAYKTTITKGGKLGNFDVRPALSKKYGIFFATTPEEQEAIESWPAYTDGKIQKMGEEVQDKELNDILAHPSVNPDKRARTHAILKYFTAAELQFCYGLTEDAYTKIRLAAIEIAEKDKGEILAEAEKANEKAIKLKEVKESKKLTPVEREREAIKNRLTELEIPFRGNPSLKVLLSLLPDGDELKPKQTEEEKLKETQDLVNRAKTGKGDKD